MSKIHVLIFPAGEINSVELNRSLAHNVNIVLYGASSINRHGEFVFKNYRGNLPLITDDTFIDTFNKLLDEWNIDVIFPTHDTVALYLIENKASIHAKIIGSDLETARICRDKRKTYNTFTGESFIPAIYPSINFFPCFIKPSIGQGGNGSHVINTESDIPTDFDNNEYIISEYLPGEELSIDCLTDSTGKLLGVYPRSRERLMSGVSVSSRRVVCTQEIKNIAEKINSRLNFTGLWYFQIKKSIHDKYKLLEISTRCPSTMCLTRSLGVNLPLLSVYIAMGINVNVFNNTYDISVDRTLINRYSLIYEYDTIYLDYDDTLISGDDVCIPVVSFLYQCKNKGINVILLSKHEAYYSESLIDSIAKHHFSMDIFDQIVSIPLDDEKSNYIKNSNSIFIDNSYAERLKIHSAKQIPVFDVEGIEVLMDWRV